MTNPIYRRVKYITCDHCNSDVSASNFNRHYLSKSCVSNTTHRLPYTNCPHCDIDLNGLDHANHIRWCSSNPKTANKNTKPKSAWNSGLTKHTDDRLDKLSRIIKQLHENGVYDSVDRSPKTKRIHSVITRAKMSESARNSKHVRKCKRTHEFTDKKGRCFHFDSSWEDALAIRLDFLDINWVRPEPISYIQNGRTRHYFPDFYLPDYDLYLDPKNSWVEKQQKEKLDIVSNLINLKIIRTLEDCNEFTI